MRTLINAPTVSATLYRLADWLQGRPVSVQQNTVSAPTRSTVVPLLRPASKLALAQAGGGAAVRQRPLRVLRIVDSQGRAAGGRMVISGRMADVCAELDRLAGKEAAAA